MLSPRGGKTLPGSPGMLLRFTAHRWIKEPGDTVCSAGGKMNWRGRDARAGTKNSKGRDARAGNNAGTKDTCKEHCPSICET